MAGGAQNQAVTITRQADGRHAITDAQGNVLGLHNSPVSAARQASTYFGQPTAEPMEYGAAHTAAQAPVYTPNSLQAAQEKGDNGQQAAQLMQQQLMQKAAVAQVAAHAQNQALLPARQANGTPEQIAQANGGPVPSAQAQAAQLAQHQANVNLVNRLSAPGQPNHDSTAQLQAAWNAFHPNAMTATIGAPTAPVGKPINMTPGGGNTGGPPQAGTVMTPGPIRKS